MGEIKNMIKKQPKLTNKTSNKLKEVVKKYPETILSEDAKFALKIKGELTGQIAVTNYNKFLKS